MVFVILFRLFGDEFHLLGGLFGGKRGFMLGGSSGDVLFLGFVGLFVLIDMGVEIVHDFFELLMDFDFFVVGGWFTGFGLDKDDGFDGVFLDRLIALSVKELKLFVFFTEKVLSEFVGKRGLGLVLMSVIFFHG